MSEIISIDSLLEEEGLSLTKAPTEDPSEFIAQLEIGLLHEESFLEQYNKMSYRLFVDMDGVLTDWMKQYKAFDGPEFGEGEEPDMSVTDNFNFWFSMAWLEGGKELWDSIKHLNPVILSSPGLSSFAVEGKQSWARENLGENVQVTLTPNKDEYADGRSILMDDMEKNINPWNEREGLGILYNGSPSSACRKLYTLVMGK